MFKWSIVFRQTTISAQSDTIYQVRNIQRTIPSLLFRKKWNIPSGSTHRVKMSCHVIMGESSKSRTLKIQTFKQAVCLQNNSNFTFNWSIVLRPMGINQKSCYSLLNSAFWGWLSIESQPQNPEFRNNPENFHPCVMNLHFCTHSRYTYTTFAATSAKDLWYINT